MQANPTAPAALARKVYESLGDLYVLIQRECVGVEAQHALSRYALAIASTTKLAATAISSKENGAPRVECETEAAPSTGARQRAGDSSPLRGRRGRTNVASLERDDALLEPSQELANRDGLAGEVGFLDPAQALTQREEFARNVEGFVVGHSISAPSEGARCWRRARDSNPRWVAPLLISNPALDEERLAYEDAIREAELDHDPARCTSACCNTPLALEVRP